MEEFSVIGLFVSAIISSTLLPGGSEIVLMYLATQTEENHLLLWSVASVGNTLGGISSWVLGWWVATKFPKRALSEIKHERALGHIRKWGAGSLIFSWLPVIGDPLCFVAGWLKISIAYSILFIALGKSIRYAILLALV